MESTTGDDDGVQYEQKLSKRKHSVESEDALQKENADETSDRRIKERKLSPTLQERPRRERKQVEKFVSPATEKATVKTIQLPDGKGTPLEEISQIHNAILKMDLESDVLRGFHALVFGRVSNKQPKADLLRFNGFNFKSDKERDYVLSKLGRWQVKGLRELAKVLDLESSISNKEPLIDRIFGFLMNPSFESTKTGRAQTPKKSTPRSTVSKRRVRNSSPGAPVISQPAYASVTTGHGMRTPGVPVPFIPVEVSTTCEAGEWYPVVHGQPLQSLQLAPNTPFSVPLDAFRVMSPVMTRGCPAEAAVNGQAPKFAPLSHPDEKSPAEPTDEALFVEIARILNGESLEQMTIKKVRSKLEHVFQTSLTHRKAFIRDQIDRLLAAEPDD
ncbi:hypothetical protein BC832DRAFT_593614 [Gaertneriomyces semiglobifer]|nr:hypothetical protein BC832DRAFT_593614 [Gaertneriomyces semiglobifer]